MRRRPDVPMHVLQQSAQAQAIVEKPFEIVSSGDRFPDSTIIIKIIIILWRGGGNRPAVFTHAIWIIFVFINIIQIIDKPVMYIL